MLHLVILLVYLAALTVAEDAHVKISTLQHPFRGSKASLPYCYEDESKRLQGVRGEFVSLPYRIARYWNLSCPLEISKQSCSRHNYNNTHAEFAARLHFIPLECELLPYESLLPYFALKMNLNIVFVGNSLMRQVLTGMVCELHSMGLVERMEIQWHDCSAGHPYPCHGTRNCITCGEHSGTDDFIIHLVGGTYLWFIDAQAVARDEKLGQYNERIDLIVVQRHHMEMINLGIVEEYRSKNLLNIPKLIYMPSYTGHFPTGGTLFYERHGGGMYNETNLEILKQKYGSLECLRTIDNLGEDLGNIEMNYITPYIKLMKIEGFLWLQGMNSLGEAKVGLAVGKYGDCQHYCEPGPADEFGRALIQQILAIM